MPVVRSGRTAFVVAGVLGTAHAAFSLYWGLGGGWLLSTLGERILDTFAGLEWVLIPVGLLKLAAAWLPALANSSGWPVARTSRIVAWLAVAVLVGWGGLNTVVGNLVVSGVIDPDGGYDRAGMIGHAFLWDPLFLAWGLALGVGLVLTRARFAALARAKG